ncbi:MAG: hypothetical protein H8D75_02415 [Rhodospirillaceae bacterium]|nr:hypothetical protein [Rhodospirillaceae bacterium]MBL6932973.1 hypothetical protein [Rhodospirillales bacterium]
MTMIKGILPIVLALVFGFSLMACEATVPGKAFPELTYRHLGQIDLLAGTLETVTTYKPPIEAPNVDHLFPTPPLNALSRWSADRLMVSGSEDVARFTILDASVRETSLNKQEGIKGAFTRDQSERYDGALEATLEILDANGGSKGFASARVTRSISIREDATVNDREQAWFKLTETLMKDFDTELKKNISRYLANWVR